MGTDTDRITTHTAMDTRTVTATKWIDDKRSPTMKKVSALLLAAIFAAVLLTPAQSFAYWRGPCCGPRVVYHGYGYPGAAIAAGVLGGIATGIFLGGVLAPPPPAAAYPPPPPPAPGDAYNSGYAEGYQQGVERGQAERYRQGRDRGYQDGYDASRSGRY
jgi:hypothetical protein